MLPPKFLYVGKPLIIFYIHIHTYASMHVYTIILFKWMICLIHACISAQLYPTLFYSMDCSLPVSSVHGIFQARIMERVAISSSRGSSQPSDGTHVSCVSCIDRWILYQCATWEAHQCTQRLCSIHERWYTVWTELRVMGTEKNKIQWKIEREDVKEHIVKMTSRLLV